MKYIFELSQKQYNTIYTAVRLEYERLYGDKDVAPLLKDALDQLKNFKVER